MSVRSVRNAILLIPMLLASTSLSTKAADVTPQRLMNADKEPQNWLMVNKDYNSHRYSTLDQINKENVKNLHVAFIRNTRRKARTGWSVCCAPEPGRRCSGCPEGVCCSWRQGPGRRITPVTIPPPPARTDLLVRPYSMFGLPGTCSAGVRLEGPSVILLATVSFTSLVARCVTDRSPCPPATGSNSTARMEC